MSKNRKEFEVIVMSLVIHKSLAVSLDQGKYDSIIEGFNDACDEWIDYLKSKGWTEDEINDGMNAILSTLSDKEIEEQMNLLFNQYQTMAQMEVSWRSDIRRN